MIAGGAPAMLSPSLATLFPPGVICAELMGSGDPDSLMTQEAPCVERAVASRREEFAAGRACARLALRELAIVDFPLKAAEDRRPLWPPGLTGSITHTRGYCAAVVARETRIKALGIDTEKTGSVKPELWPRICGPESAWLHHLPAADRPVGATLIFCIKEAFYKCQFTLTGQYLGFEDARVEISAWSLERGDFQVHACKPMAITQHVSLPLAGHYRFHQGFVTAGIAIAATDQ